MGAVVSGRRSPRFQQLQNCSRRVMADASCDATPFDACDDIGLAALLRCRASRAELLLIATTGESSEQLAWLANAVANVQALNLPWLLLRETAASCERAKRLLWMRAGLSTDGHCAFCGASETARLGLHPGPSSDASINELLFLRWVVADRVLRQRVSVLSIGVPPGPCEELLA